MQPGNSRKSPLAWSLVRASLLLLLLVAGQSDGTYLAGKEPLGAGDELQQDGRAGDLGEFASLAALLRDYLAGRLQGLPSSSKARFAESAGAPQSVAKRGVMMGVDLPDFILNRNQPSMKNLQVLRQRLFEGGRRR